MIAAPVTNPCDRCGEPAPILRGLDGAEVPARYCVACGDLLLQQEEQGNRIRAETAALDRAGRSHLFAGYILETHPNRDAVAKAEAWLEDWWERGNLWLSGPVGTGKSGLAWGIVHRVTVQAVDAYYATPSHERLRDDPADIALFLRWADLLADLKASFDTERRGDVADPSALLARAARIHLLVLDDLGRERPTAYAVEQLANLVEARYHRIGVTVITSNYNTRDLADRLSFATSAIDGERIVSRLLEGATGFRFSGESLRRAAQT